MGSIISVLGFILLGAIVLVCFLMFPKEVLVAAALGIIGLISAFLLKR